MRKSISRPLSIFLALALSLSAIILSSPYSDAVSSNIGKLSLDFNAADGYEGDYVIIYNPSTSANSVLSSGSLAGKIVSSSLNSKSENIDGKQSVRFVAPEVVYPPFSLFSKQLITTEAYTAGQQHTFNVFSSMGSTTLISKTFTLAYEGSSCYVWYIPTEQYAITQAQAVEIANEYDNFIAPTMLENFGSYYDPQSSGHLNILVYDLKDDFGTNSQKYHSGFFWSGDFVNTYGNMAAMIHIDTYPTITYDGTSSLDEAFSTIVHEMQHLINYSRYWTNPSSVGESWMSTWLDEACSMAAEEAVYPSSILPSRINYLTSHDSLYTSGYSAYAWTDSDLSCYSMNCLFGQYLKAQTGDYDSFKTMLDVFGNDASPTDEKAIMAALESTALDGKSLSDVMLAFRIALIANDPDDYDGIYGFGTSTDFNDVPAMLYTSTEATNIYGGGAIVIQPKGGIFTPASDSSSGLVYVGITLSDTSSLCVVDNANKLISNIEPNTTESKLCDLIGISFPDVSSVVIMESFGSYVGTGASAYIYTNNASRPSVYSVVIHGDVNGNGTIEVADATLVMNHIVGSSSLIGAYLKAADINHDGYVNVADATGILSHIVGLSSISQN